MGRSTSIPHYYKPLTLPPPPPPPSPPPLRGIVVASEDAAPGPSAGAHHRRLGIVTIPCLAKLQAAEDALHLVLVVMVGGTRPVVSPAMVAALFERFDIMAGEAEVRRHDPEDFIMRFRQQEDHDRVLASHPRGRLATASLVAMAMDVNGERDHLLVLCACGDVPRSPPHPERAHGTIAPRAYLCGDQHRPTFGGP